MNDITRKVFYPSSLGVISSIKAFIFVDGLAFCGHDCGSDGRGKKDEIQVVSNISFCLYIRVMCKVRKLIHIKLHKLQCY